MKGNIKEVASGVETKTLSELLAQTEFLVRRRFKLTKSEFFWAIADGGLEYLKAHQHEAWFKEMARDKGFWHWYKQVWHLSVVKTGFPHDKTVAFDEWHGWVKYSLDKYSCEPVLRAMYNKVEYSGRVAW